MPYFLTEAKLLFVSSRIGLSGRNRVSLFGLNEALLEGAKACAAFARLAFGVY